jgi:hypothetical protein
MSRVAFPLCSHRQPLLLLREQKVPSDIGSNGGPKRSGSEASRMLLFGGSLWLSLGIERSIPEFDGLLRIGDNAAGRTTPPDVAAYTRSVLG